MKNIGYYLIVLFVCSSCGVFQPKIFTKEALDEKLVTLTRDSISFREVLSKNRGKEIFIQVFASYCPVSQDSFDDVLSFQEKYDEKEYVFLSVDHTYHDWKRGVERIKPKGQFYYISKKGKGALGKFLNLKTIPRFLKVDKLGIIKVFKTSKVSEKLK